MRRELVEAAVVEAARQFMAQFLASERRGEPAMLSVETHYALQTLRDSLSSQSRVRVRR